MKTATKNRQRRDRAAAPAPAETPAPAVPGAARDSDERLQNAAAYLRIQVSLWQQRNQVGALDDYLGHVDAGNKTANLRQYSEYHRAVQSAAEILRGPLSDQLQSAGYREPSFTSPQPWKCPDCHCLLGQPGEKHEPCDIPVTVIVTGHEPVDGPPITSPRVFSSELPEEDEDRLEAVFGPNVRVLPAAGEDGEDEPGIYRDTREGEYTGPTSFPSQGPPHADAPAVKNEPAEDEPHAAGDGDEPQEALDEGPPPETGEVTTPSSTYELDTPQPDGQEDESS